MHLRRGVKLLFYNVYNSWVLYRQLKICIMLAVKQCLGHIFAIIFITAIYFASQKPPGEFFIN